MVPSRNDRWHINGLKLVFLTLFGYDNGETAECLISDIAKYKCPCIKKGILKYY